ncbi:hypothetical protein [Tenacibaculum sp. UWU-22]|uniref:hypothetical protein n=1 Tax=Tenacibaculum sp. UWU-22 TaxID=3234187 RepID=UPI0034DB41D1
MHKLFNTKSNIFTLIINGKIEHILSPWTLELDLNKETITILKRNLYYIGTDTNTISFKYIRKIEINEHLFGSDITIRAIGGSVSARFLPKKDLQVLREKLIEYNQTKTNHIIFS